MKTWLRKGSILQMAMNKYAAYNMDLATQMEYLTSIVLMNPVW